MSVTTDPLQQQLSGLLQRRGYDLYQRFWQTVIDRDQADDADEQTDKVLLRMHALLRGDGVAPSTSEPAPDDSRSVSPSDRSAGCSRGSALADLARSLGLAPLAEALAELSDDTDDRVFESVQQLLGVMTTIRTLEQQRASNQSFDFTVGQILDLALLGSRLYYQGVYRQWRPAVQWSHAQILTGARALLQSLQQAGAWGERLYAVEDRYYDSAVHELVGNAEGDGKILPLGFGVKAGPPDKQHRMAQVTAWQSEWVAGHRQ